MDYGHETIGDDWDYGIAGLFEGSPGDIVVRHLIFRRIFTVIRPDQNRDPPPQGLSSQRQMCETRYKILQTRNLKMVDS